MVELGIDIETYSSVSLKESGMFKYAEAPDFDILLLSYSLENAPVRCIDLANGEPLPDEFMQSYYDKDVLKTAFNAMFELTCLDKYLDEEANRAQWECTMVKVGMVGYPMSLDKAAKILNIADQKDAMGKKLLKLFSVPNKFGQRNLAQKFLAEWEAFKKYNVWDVKVEQGIRDAVKWFKIPEKEKRIWVLDQKINRRGIKLDKRFVHQAIGINERTEASLIEEAKKITKLDNPNSVKQLLEWLQNGLNESSVITNLQKETIKNILKIETDRDTKRVLEIRQELAKSSVKKYYTMLDCICDDDRARGLLQLYGANKTGRWAGRLIQIQNLTKTKYESIGAARDIALLGDLDMLEMCYGNIKQILSNLIRTSFITEEGNILLASDFSAIEARVLAWFADERWRLKVFRGDGKIYEESGARMFKCTPEQVAADRDGLRFKAKTAELALGFQGGVGAIKRMETMGLKTGLKESEMQPLVNAWRKASPNIVRFWYDVEEAAVEAVANPGKRIAVNGKLVFMVKNNILFCLLPSGRMLTYINPSLKENKFGKMAVNFWDVDQKNKQWKKQETYGGKLVENIVQGTSRDLLADAMIRLDDAGFMIVGHVHDEALMEVQKDKGDEFLKKAGEIMSQDVPWAKGLPIKAESFLTPFYIKN